MIKIKNYIDKKTSTYKTILKAFPWGRFGGALLLLCVLIFSGCGVKRRISKADKRFEIGEYYTAGDLYKSSYGKVSSKDKPLRAYVAFRQGEAYRMINHNRTSYAYLNAIRNNYPDSIVFFHYAQALQKEGKYTDAAKNYEIYLEHDSTNVAAKNGLYASQMAAEWRSNPTRYKVSKSKEFNVRRYSTFSPAYVGQSTDVLIFTSARSADKKKKTKNNAITGMPNNNMYSVRKNATGKWEAPEILEAEINTPNAENGVSAFTADGKTMYFTRARKAAADAGTEIMVSNRAGGAWSEPKPLKVFQDSTILVAHPTISSDGGTLYFVSDAPDGFGGKDIWRCKLENGECKYIENMGADINTPGDEMFPMMRHDGTLYFASDGHPGMGGLDIFRATPLAQDDSSNKTHWVVENMGVPINSQFDDFGITFAGKSESGFFSSNRNERQGYDMIWNFELPELAYVIEGKVMDDKDGIVPDATVRLVGNDGTNTRIQTRKDGSYRIKLNKNVDYVMMASARGYLNQNYKFSTQELADSKSFQSDFHLPPIFKPVQIENIFYEFGKWDLTPNSEAGLQVLLKLLNDNPNITIELSAHTDYIGNDANNKTLSEKRAESVVKYLITHGIAKDRLSSAGYGEEKPFVVDAFTAKKFPFLKENNELTEEFILKLTPAQQEIANQINRRTEFKVLKTNYNLY
ncbi:hypothetical protein D0T49_08175 [Paludibacter sp. 221]|uniref:PorE family type IX secretion system protein n=1 Tax=Paludibacter sp. 221 TaxID=2302939 RepID=UPI0013D03A83|nr:OmpA family protein [Paludibacter sp. 221]NDV47023.1 hypothetical protein [Paludibacter sp. 221]